MFALFSSGLFFGQINSDLTLSWDINVGCQEFEIPKPRAGQSGFFVENISQSDTIKVCERTRVRYSLKGTWGTNANIQWSAIGGTRHLATSSNTPISNSCIVIWGNAGMGSVTFSMNGSNGAIITKTLIIEIIKKPIADFNVIPNIINRRQIINTCIGQMLTFTDLSTTNGGTDITTHYWLFGDGNFSSAQNPQHTYTAAGTYEVKLTVTNACGCSSFKILNVNVTQALGLDISCPATVCEGQTETYTLPTNGEPVCSTYNFAVIGGTMQNPNNGTVNVKWDQVGPTGFGYLTFTPDTTCTVECSYPTTLQIPVIQSVGTIQGNAVMCLGEQDIFKLPQWPSTTFDWQILNNTNGVLATVIPTDQRNEIVIQPLQTGTIELVCTYYNTFLHCGGTARFTIDVRKPEIINGLKNLCINNVGSFSTDSNNDVDWTLRNHTNIVSSTFNSNSFSYNFTTIGTYTLQVTGANVCDNQIVSIFVNPIPATPLLSNITTPVTNVNVPVDTSSLCPLTQYTYAVTTTNPTMDYEWSITGGTIVGNANDKDVIVTFNQTGPYNLGLIQKMKGQDNCQSLMLNIQPNIFNINAQISNELNVSSSVPIPAVFTACGNNYATYHAVKDVLGSGTYDIGDTYTWSINPPTLGSITEGQGTKTVTVLWNNVSSIQQGLGTLSLIITKCTRTQAIHKNVSITPKPLLAITSPASVCNGKNITFTLTNNFNVPFVAGTIIRWSFNNNTQIQTIPTTTNTVTYTTSFNANSSSNVGYTVKATIDNFDGCSTVISNVHYIIIVPGPQAGFTIVNGNTFCAGDTITTILVPATSAGTFEWFRYPSLTPIQIGGNLNVQPFGFGVYYFKVTQGECYSYSNITYVRERICDLDPVVCGPIPYTVTVTADPTIDNNCSVLNFTATVNPPLPVNHPDPLWSVFGPDPSTNVQDEIADFYVFGLPITQAGVYTVQYKFPFVCPLSGQTVFIGTSNDVTVPYVPNFTTNIVCTGNNNYTISLSNTSSFLTTVTNRRYFYYWRSNVNNPWTLINPNSTNQQNFVYNVVGFGNNFFMLAIDGIEAGQSTASPICQKIRNNPINIAPPANEQILISNNLCYDSAIGFEVQGSLITDTFLWTFDNGAQNTQSKPKRVFNPTANGAAQTVTVSVIITNQYGCSRPLDIMVNVPARCYYGDIATTTPTICCGGAMVLNYTPSTTNPNNCNVFLYQWMDGANLIATTTVPTYTVPAVNGSPFFWLKLIDANQKCIYGTPTRIVPMFTTLPTATLTAPAIVCGNGSSQATVTTNAPNIKWYVDNVLQTNTSSSLPLNSYALGTHLLTVTVSFVGLNACSKSVSHNFTVKAAPDAPTATYTIDCTTYEVLLTAYPPLGGTGVLTWTTGTSGNPNKVYSGGPYTVSYNDGSGCITSYQINVPYSFDKYLWSFPSGCYKKCYDNLGTITGPSPYVYIPEWEWTKDGVAHETGIGIVQNYEPVHTNTYGLTLGNACPEKSLPMDLTTTKCVNCGFNEASLKTVACNYDTPFVSYALELSIDNGTAAIINTTITSVNNQVIVAPFAFVANSGLHVYSFSIIPINGFLGGNVDFTLNGINSLGKLCKYKFSVFFPNCIPINNKFGRQANSNLDFVNTKLVLFPNPAKNEVNFTYSSSAKAVEILIYDLTGKQLAEYKDSSNTGSTSFDVSNFAQGVYVVVLKEDGTNVLQQKLIIE